MIEIKVQVALDYDILYKKYFGEISLEDVFSSWKNIIEENQIPNTINKFLLDYREASLMFTIDSIEEIVNFYREHDAVFEDSKIALLMETPEQVVFPYLLKYERPSLSIKAFYTYEAALSWLKQ